MAGDVPAAAAGSMTLGGDMPVRRMGFGAMRITGQGIWGEPPDREAAKRVLRRAVELGVTLIDTADSYGPEVSENLIAEALFPYPAGLVVATKGGLTRSGPSQWHRNGKPSHLRRACEKSLQRLRVERIDLYQLHAIDSKVPLEDSVGELVKLQQEGKIRHLGLSNVSVEQLRRAQALVPIVSIQNRYNLSDRASDDVHRRLRPGVDRLPPLVSAGHRRADPPWRAPGLGGQPPRSDHRPGGAGLAPPPLAGDAPHPRHLVDRPPRGERGCRRAGAHRPGPRHPGKGLTDGQADAGARPGRGDADGPGRRTITLRGRSADLPPLPGQAATDDFSPTPSTTPASPPAASGRPSPSSGTGAGCARPTPW